MANNNPYVPGDPYSYDLKWIVEELKTAIDLYTPISQEVQDLYDFVHGYFESTRFEAQLDAALRILAADGTLAQIIQPLFDAYKVDIDAEVDNMIARIDQQDDAIDVLVARMDTFASLPAGSTSGNAELLDIRVDYEGTTWPSAGDAVRGQVEKVADNVARLIDHIGSDQIVQGNWEQNQLISTQLKRISVKDRIPVKQGDIIHMIPNGLFINVSVYPDTVDPNATEVYTWSDQDTDYTFKNSGYACISIANSYTFNTSTNISPADYVCVMDFIPMEIYDAVNKDVTYGLSALENDHEKGLIRETALYEVQEWSINQNTGVINYNAACRSIVFPCEPNRRYVVNKAAGGRFSVGESDHYPLLYEAVTNLTVNNTGDRIEILTSKTAKYIISFVYYSVSDTDYTADQMMASVKIYNDVAKDVTKPFWLVEENRKSVYDTINRPFYYTGFSLSGATVQSLIEDDGKFFVFTSSPGGVYKLERGKNAVFNSVSVWDHVQSTELLENGNFLVASTNANSTRSIYEYDFENDAMISSFTPTITGNMIFASQIGQAEYLIGAWVDTSNNLYFYDYDAVNDQATELFHYVVPRTYAQGGCRVGKLLYLSVNDGYSGNTDALILVFEWTTGSLLNVYTLQGFGECEGADVKADPFGNILLYTSDNNDDAKIYGIKL